MRILYVIAMYGPEYLGNLIHRELGQELMRRGHTFEVLALTQLKQSVGTQAAAAIFNRRDCQADRVER